MSDDVTPCRTFRELVDRTGEVVAGFDAHERRPWTIARHVMVVEQYYLSDRDSDLRYATTKDDVADELADILHALIRIADHYGIDLEEAHIRAREREMDYLRRAGDG